MKNNIPIRKIEDGSATPDVKSCCLGETTAPSSIITRHSKYGFEIIRFIPNQLDSSQSENLVSADTCGEDHTSFEIASTNSILPNSYFEFKQIGHKRT